MNCIVLALAVAAVAVADDQTKKLIGTIDSLQAPLEDFRCEFEGTVHDASQSAPGSPVAPGERRDSFSGMFLWKKNGGFWCDSFHENSQRSRRVERRTMVVRSHDKDAEEYRRINDVVDGQRTFGSPSVFRAQPDFEGPQSLFLIDDFKDQASDQAYSTSVRDDQVDGSALKVLEISVKDIKQLMRRYWIDLGRNGHVVRFEAYWKGEQIWLRRDIKLASFRVSDAQIWMPVSAEQVTYSSPTASETGKSDPESIATMSILKGTTAFNVHLDAKDFTIGFKSDRPTSENVQRRSAQFDRQTLGAEQLEAKALKANKDLLGQDAEPNPAPVPAPEAAIRPDSQSGLRYVAIGFAVVAVIAFIRVRARQRLRG
jgi:hypothetical protein